MAMTRVRSIAPAQEGLRTDDVAINAAMKEGSGEMLRRLLRYGLAHDRDFGMGADAFHALCAVHGVRSRESAAP
jgi:hypothetical protein